MRALKAIFRAIVGAVFGVVAIVALLPAFAAIFPVPSMGAVLPLAMVPVGILLGVFAPTIRRALGRGFLLAGTAILALPLSALLLSGRVASHVVTATDKTDQAIQVVGAGLAGAAITGVAAFVGLIGGGIFIIIGLVLALGGRREVIIVERR